MTLNQLLSHLQNLLRSDQSVFHNKDKHGKSLWATASKIINNVEKTMKKVRTRQGVCKILHKQNQKNKSN